uniref:Uncharacterized protein n=5 Tax=unclassified Prevotella TaxID=2638335 RepID=A0AB33JP35_9BACT
MVGFKVESLNFVLHIVNFVLKHFRNTGGDSLFHVYIINQIDYEFIEDFFIIPARKKAYDTPCSLCSVVF